MPAIRRAGSVMRESFPRRSWSGGIRRRGPAMTRAAYARRLAAAGVVLGERPDRPAQPGVGVEAAHELALAPAALRAHDVGGRTLLRHTPLRHAGEGQDERRPARPRVALSARESARRVESEQRPGLAGAFDLRGG